MQYYAENSVAAVFGNQPMSIIGNCICAMLEGKRCSKSSLFNAKDLFHL